MKLLNVPFREQQQVADCLAACAAMVLDYLGQRYRYKRLLSLLRIQDFGTSFYNLDRIDAIGVKVTYHTGDVDWLRAMLDKEIPVIVYVNTSFFEYWDVETNHAVVVIGYDQENFVTHDPDSEPSSRTVSQVVFELAWLEQDYLCATIRR